MADDELGPLPEAFARDVVVRRVGVELGRQFFDHVVRHQLTYAEQFSILSGMLAECAKFAMRAERERRR